MRASSALKSHPISSPNRSSTVLLVVLAILTHEKPFSSRLISPWGALMKESPPLSREIASRNKLSLVGAPFAMMTTVTMDSGLSQTSCFTTAFQLYRVLAVRLFLLTWVEFLCTENDSFGMGPEMAGIRWAESPTCQNLLPLFQMELSCHASCISSPINMLAVMSLTMYAKLHNPFAL